MKNKILITAILLTGLLSASTYHYTFKISDMSLFNNSSNGTHISNDPIMQNATPEERTYVQSDGRILATDAGIDWYGEVTSESLITGNALSSLLELSGGSSQNSNAGWLHVGIDGKELFIAKKPFRSRITWNNLNNANALNGSRIININGQNYKVRVLTALTNFSTEPHGFDLNVMHGSEWNRIMYRLTSNVYSDNRNIKSSENPFINLANYTEEDLILHSSFGEGSHNWGYEEVSGGYKYGVGNVGVSYIRRESANTNVSRMGWRPVLEKVN